MSQVMDIIIESGKSKSAASSRPRVPITINYFLQEGNRGSETTVFQILHDIESPEAATRTSLVRLEHNPWPLSDGGSV